MRMHFFISAFIASFLTFFLVLFRTTRKTYGGFDTWTLGVAAQAAGYALIGLRGFIPDPVSIIGGNGSFAAGCLLQLVGLRHFLGLRPMTTVSYVGLSLFTVTLLTVYLLSFPSSAYSMMVGAAVLLTRFKMAYLVASQSAGRASAPYWTIGTIMVIAGAVVLYRGIWSLYSPDFHVMMNSDVQLFSFFVIITCHIGENLAFIMLNNERVENELLDVESLLKQTVVRLQESLIAQKQTEESLRQSEQQYRLLADKAIDFIWTVDVEANRFLYVSPSVERMLGYSVDEIREHGFEKTLSPESSHYLWSVVPPRIDQFRRGETDAFSDELEHIHKDGHSVWTEANLRYRLNNTTGRIEANGVSRDITERKTSECERQTLQNQLIESRKLASVGTLVGGLAHDFNNMLQIIIGFSEILLDRVRKASKEHASVMNILDTATQGADLIRKLLATGQQSQTFPKAIELNEKIRLLIHSFREKLPDNVRVEVDLTEDSTTIMLDPEQISQLIMNIISNSSEAMPDGGQLKISTRRICLDKEFCKTVLDAKPGDYVLLVISDSGKGMDEETLRQIFDPFFSTKPRGTAKGTGLGLSIVRGTVQQQGGFIECSSAMGKGTEFRIYFPEVKIPHELSGSASSDLNIQGAETILLVEDVSFIAELEKTFFTDAGYKVIVASNGQEAIDIYRERQTEIALVILDLLMPVMGGKECLAELLKINPSIKALVVSGYSPEDALSKEVAPYVKGFVSKPCKKSDLLRKARSAIDS